MRIRRLGLVVLVGLLLAGTQGLTQPGPQDRGPYRLRDGRGFPPPGTPSDSRGVQSRGEGSPFDRLGNGKPVLIRSDLDVEGQAAFDRLAEKLGATGGQITRDQFSTYRGQRKSERSAGTLPEAGKPKDKLSGGPDSATLEGRAEESFRRHDKNGDGLLSFEEMPEELRANLAAWDRDQNGLIDLPEYKAYFLDRWEHRKVDRGQSGKIPAESEALSPEQTPPLALPNQNQPVPGRLARRPAPAAQPLVYHADNLPRELPAWFAQLDTNHDAQIGLYEWKVSGRPLAEFRAMDRNNDGFLTVEEVLAYQARTGKASPGSPNSGGRPLFSSRTAGNR